MKCFLAVTNYCLSTKHMHTFNCNKTCTKIKQFSYQIQLCNSVTSLQLRVLFFYFTIFSKFFIEIRLKCYFIVLLLKIEQSFRQHSDKEKWFNFKHPSQKLLFLT